MSLSQNYGVLRVVHTRSSAFPSQRSALPSTRWLREERFIHLLTHRVTTIGRSLNNELILLDPLVSREHARLELDDQGWCLYNLTVQNAVHVNGQPVVCGECMRVVPQDMLTFGETVLQLVAPEDAKRTHIDAPDLPAAFSRIDSPFPSLLYSLFYAKNATKSMLKDAEYTNDLLVTVGDSNDEPSFSSHITPTVLSCPDEEQDRELFHSSKHARKSSIFDTNLAMQLALPAPSRIRLRWWFIGIVLLSMLITALLSFSFNSLLGLPSLIHEGPLSLVTVLAIPIVPAIGINLLVNFVDRYEREPWFLRLSAFLWGAIIAIPPTLFIEQYIQDRRFFFLGPHPSPALHAFFSGLNAGVTEETVKGLGLLLLFFVLRDEFDNITDGIVYGALIGAGFAMVENFFYFSSNPRNVVFLVIGRIVLGWLSHSTFTVCFGAALGYIRHTRARWKHIVVPLAGYIIAVGMHTLFDFTSVFVSSLVLAEPTNTQVVLFSVFAYSADYILPLIAQLGIVYCLIQSLTHEAALIREFLAAEVCNGIVSVDEYALLQYSFIRTRIERRVFIRYGWKQWHSVRRLYQTEIGLAFRKWHVSMGDKPKLGYLQPEDAYRQRILALRQQILAAEAEREKRTLTHTHEGKWRV